jgi:hypothetical protein
VYERKTYILGLTSAFNAEVMPTSMQTHLLKIIQQVIAMLNKLKLQEAKDLQKAAKREIKADDSDEDDDDNSGDEGYEDDDEDDDEEEEEDDKMDEDEEEAKHSDHEEDGATGGGPPGESKKTKKPADYEEEKGDDNGGGLGFVDNDEDKDSNEDDGEDDDEDEDELIDEAFDLNVTMDMLNAPFKKTDEFGFFNTQFRSLYDRDMTYINNLVS